MSVDRTGDAPGRRETSHPRSARPAPPIPVEVGQENPLPDAEKPDQGPGAERVGEKEREHIEEQLDHGLEQTFPASDPVAIQGDR